MSYTLWVQLISTDMLAVCLTIAFSLQAVGTRQWRMIKAAILLEISLMGILTLMAIWGLVT